MLLGPVKALYSMKFYSQSLNKSAWKAVLFVLYIFFITIVLTSILSILFIRPGLFREIDTMVDYMPEMTITEGIIEVNDNEPLVISPERMEGYNIVFDTGRTEPVYPTEMKNDKTLILVGPDRIYFSFEDRFQETQMPADLNADINRSVLNASKDTIANIAMAAVLLFMVIAQLFRIPFMLLLAFAVTAVMSRTMRASSKPGDNFKLACYMQAPALLIYLISYFTPAPGFLVGFAYLIVFIIYGQIFFSAKGLEALPENQREETNSNEESEPQESDGDDSENN